MTKPNTYILCKEVMYEAIRIQMTSLNMTNILFTSLMKYFWMRNAYNNNE